MSMSVSPVKAAMSAVSSVAMARAGSVDSLLRMVSGQSLSIAVLLTRAIIIHLKR